MTSQTLWVLFGLAFYITVIILIGFWSTRYAKATLEDYAMASRSLGTWVLFSSVFAANISAVTLIGVPGAAYHNGWIMWAYFVTTWAWSTPLFFYILHSRAWLLGKRFGYMTQAEIMSGRWDSKFLGYLCSGILLLYTVPYLMTGVQGGGVALTTFTQGYIPFWLSSLIVIAVVLVYLVLGGLRGAAWVNTLQAALFMGGIVTIFFAVAYSLGGPALATQKVAAQYPGLLDRRNMTWQVFFSFGVMDGLATQMFPQLFMRMLTGKEPKALKQTTLVYPAASMLVFFLVAYCGMWGHAVFPNLQGKASDNILPMLLVQYAPVWMMAILAGAIFAALMSTMDSQLMAAATLLMKDFFLRSPSLQRIEQERLVWAAKALVIGLAAVAYILAQLNPQSIIQVFNFAVGGFAVIIVPLTAALYWRRCTKEAAISSLIVSQFVLVGLQYGIIPKKLGFGFLPGFPAIVVALLVLVVVTYLTPVPNNPGTQSYFRLFETSLPAFALRRAPNLGDEGAIKC